MAELGTRIQDDIKSAMRAGDKSRVAALRLILAAIKQIEVDERITLDETRLLQLLDKLAKQRRESIEQYQKANRQDLIDIERYELNLIQEYLPQPLSDDEINDLIQQAIQVVAATQIKDMGKVMAHLKPQLQGRADMSKVSQKIKQLLA